MTLIASDIIEGTLEINNGVPSQPRTFLIRIPETVAGHAKQWAAYQNNRVPQLNDPHPTVPNIVARNFSVEPYQNDNQIMAVTVGYEEPPAIEESPEQGNTGKTVEVSVDTYTEGTLFDKDGNLMTIRYVKLTSAGVTQLVQNLEFQVERPTSTVRITEETTRIPKRFILDGFVGSVNSVEWSGFPPLTWLLRGITTTQIKKGRNRVTWVFTYNRNTWQAEGRVSDGGQVPNNATLDNGIAYFRVYPELDFKLTGQEF